MRAIEFIKGHVIYNPAYTGKFQLKTTFGLESIVGSSVVQIMTKAGHQKPKYLKKTTISKYLYWDSDGYAYLLIGFIVKMG